MRFHGSYRSVTRRALWIMATASPNRAETRRIIWGVSTISGTSTNAVRPRSRASATRCRYTRVLPLPVTPCKRTASGLPVSARARMAA